MEITYDALVSNLMQLSINSLSSCVHRLSHHSFNWLVNPWTRAIAVSLSDNLLDFNAVTSIVIWHVKSSIPYSLNLSKFHSTILDPVNELWTNSPLSSNCISGYVGLI